jgi:hypothetical protein
MKKRITPLQAQLILAAFFVLLAVLLDFFTDLL